MWATLPGATAEELLREVVIFESTEVTDAGVVQFAGVERAQREPLWTEESAQEPPDVHIAASIEAFLADVTGDPSAAIEVAVGLDREQWDDTVSVPHQQALALLDGQVATNCDLAAVRAATVEQRSLAGQSVVDEVSAQIESLGGRVLSSSGLTGTLTFTASRAALQAILELPEIGSLDIPVEPSEDAGISMTVTGDLDGIELSDLIQAEPFYLQGYEGSTTEQIGVTETEALTALNTHVSFYTLPQGDPANINRVHACGGTGSICTSQLNWAPATVHSTSVTSIIASDLTAGQDTSYTGTDTTDQRNRSGIARKGYTLNISDWPETERDRAIDIFAADPDVFLLNHSASGNVDPECTGADANSDAWNALYEAGIATFQSNGNANHDVITDCTVQSPGSALGMMTVAAYQVNSSGAEVLYSGNSLGGAGSEGGGRSINGLTAPSNRTLSADSTSATGYKSNAFCCTSGATPALTGAAALFRQYWRAERTSLIDDPGILYANLLLMGDRENHSGYLSTGFDSITGAGKIRLRTWDPAGLDDPSGWSSGTVCVPNGQSVNYTIHSGSAIPSHVDYLKVVAWWYDHDHDDGNPHDKIDLRIQKQVISGVWTTPSHWKSETDDNKQRVYATDVTGEVVRFQLSGRSVSGSDEGCGTDANKVYWALLWEDNARDDDSTLTTYTRPEP